MKPQVVLSTDKRNMSVTTPHISNSIDEDLFLSRVRDFVAREVLPNTREWEKNTSFPDDIWGKLAELGLLGMTLSKEKGGLGLSCSAYVQVCRELAKGDPALSMNIAAMP